MDAHRLSGPPVLLPEDYYMEGQYMVFTAAYHLKRGYCCGSGCRHCPYQDGKAETPTSADCRPQSAPPPAED